MSRLLSAQQKDHSIGMASDERRVGYSAAECYIDTQALPEYDK